MTDYKKKIGIVIVGIMMGIADVTITSAHTLESVKSLQQNKVAQLQRPIMRQGSQPVGTYRVIQQGGSGKGRNTIGGYSQPSGSLPAPVSSQKRYGFTQRCNQYGCVSVPNH
jgi:hypothetical protein